MFFIIKDKVKYQMFPNRVHANVVQVTTQPDDVMMDYFFDSSDVLLSQRPVIAVYI